MTEPHPSVIKRFLAGFQSRTRHVPAAAPNPDANALVHDLNNILGVVIGCFDEQLEQLDKPGELNQVKLRELAEDGLAAALRGAALTQRRTK